jgi:hypothetical protein
MIFKTERKHHEISFPPNWCAHTSAASMISVPLMVSALEQIIEPIIVGGPSP